MSPVSDEEGSARFFRPRLGSRTCFNVWHRFERTHPFHQQPFSHTTYKVVDFKKGTNEATKFAKGLKEMSRTIPLSAAELAQIAASGGQLGIKKEDLFNFTEFYSHYYYNFFCQTYRRKLSNNGISCSDTDVDFNTPQCCFFIIIIR